VCAEPCSNPLNEAQAFLGFLKRGTPVEKLRADISTQTPYRRTVLRLFDALRGDIRPLQKQVWFLLRTLSLAEVRTKLGISESLFCRCIGRRASNRPFEETDAILARIRKGATENELRREFGISFDYAAKLRRLLGLREKETVAVTPSKLRRFTPPEIRQMEAGFEMGLSNSLIARQMQADRTTIWQRRRRWRNAQ
jgi:hypothetical protein